MDSMRRLIQILIILLCLALLAGMTVMIFRYRAEARTRAAQISALSAQAREYESELMRLRREQEVQEMQLYTPEGPGAAIVAFRIGDEETLEAAVAYGEAYGFTPSVIVNVDEENAAALLETLADRGLDIIFGCNTFSNRTETALRAMTEKAENAGCSITSSFLLRAGDDNEENRKTLKRAGVTTLFLYGDVLSSTVSDDFTELNYSYISRSGYNPSSRLSDLRGSEQGLLFAVDLVETTVTERQTEEILSLIREEQNAGHIVLSSVSGAALTVQDRVDHERQRVEEFLAVQETRSARIAELEETIREIYSHWDD